MHDAERARQVTSLERMWHIEDSQAANVEHIRQFRPDSGRGFRQNTSELFCERQVTSLRSRANVAPIRQSRPNSGRGFQAKDPKTFQVVPSSLPRDPGAHVRRRARTPCYEPLSGPKVVSSLSSCPCNLLSCLWSIRQCLVHTGPRQYSDQDILSGTSSFSLLLSSLELSDTQVYQP